jgi:hypothetical protein
MDICNKCEGPYNDGKCFCYYREQDAASEDFFASLPEDCVRIEVPDPRGYKMVVCQRKRFSSMHAAHETCPICAPDNV